MNSQNLTLFNQIFSVIVFLVTSSSLIALSILTGLVTELLMKKNFEQSKDKENKLFSIHRIVIWAFIALCLGVIFADEKQKPAVFREPIFFWAFAGITFGTAIASIVDIAINIFKLKIKTDNFERDFNIFKAKMNKKLEKAELDELIKSACNLLKSKNELEPFKKITYAPFNSIYQINIQRYEQIDNELITKLYDLIKKIYPNLEDWFPSVGDRKLYSSNAHELQKNLIELAERIEIITNSKLCDNIVNSQALIIMAKGKFYPWTKNQVNSGSGDEYGWNIKELQDYFDLSKRAAIQLKKCIEERKNINSDEISLEEMMFDCCQLQGEIAQKDNSIESFKNGIKSFQEVYNIVEYLNKKRKNSTIKNLSNRLCYFYHSYASLIRENYKENIKNLIYHVENQEDKEKSFKMAVAFYDLALDIAKEIEEDGIKLIQLSCYEGSGELYFIKQKGEEKPNYKMAQKAFENQCILAEKLQRSDYHFKALEWLARISYEDEKIEEAYSFAQEAIRIKINQNGSYPDSGDSDDFEKIFLELANKKTKEINCQEYLKRLYTSQSEPLRITSN